jgi:hypothetical protein
MQYPIYTGDEAREKVDHLLKSVGQPWRSQYQLRLPEDRCCGYFHDGERWIAFDNRDGNCWVEEFRSEKRCLKYLNT